KQPLYTSTTKLNAAAKAAGIAVARGADLWAVRTAVFNAMVKPQGSNFDTGGIYAKTQMTDIGPGKSQFYVQAVAGKMQISAKVMRAPDPNRTRNPVAASKLGSEIFWNTGPNPKTAPAGAPAIFLVACRGDIWNGGRISNPDENELSIGLILRFNNFFYY